MVDFYTLIVTVACLSWIWCPKPLPMTHFDIVGQLFFQVESEPYLVITVGRFVGYAIVVGRHFFIGKNYLRIRVQPK